MWFLFEKRKLTFEQDFNLFTSLIIAFKTVGKSNSYFRKSKRSSPARLYIPFSDKHHI